MVRPGFMSTRKSASTAGMKSTSRHQAGIGGMTHLGCEKVGISNFNDTFQQFMPPSTFKLPCSFSLDVSKCHSAWCTWLTSFFLLIILILSSVSYWTRFRSYVVIACHSQPTLQCLKVCHQSGSKSCEHVELKNLAHSLFPENFSGFLQPSEWLPMILCFWMISKVFPHGFSRWSVAARGFVRQQLPAAWRAAAHAQLDFCQVRDAMTRYRSESWKIWKEILKKTSSKY